MHIPKAVFFLLFTLAALSGQAQERVLLRHPNGQPALSGNCTFYFSAGLPESIAKAAHLDNYLELRPQPMVDALFTRDADSLPITTSSFSYRGDRLYRTIKQNTLARLCISCDGPVKRYYAHGQTAETTVFTAGMPTGPYTAYYPNGTVMIRATLHQGAPTGVFTMNYKHGTAFVTAQYSKYPDSLMQRVAQGLLSMAFPEDTALKLPGMPKQTDTLTEYGLRNYIGKEYNALNNLFVRYDQLLVRLPSIGIKDGVFRFSYRSGKKWAEMSFRNNLRVGTWVLWNEAGEPWSKLHYNEGVLEKVTDSSRQTLTLEAYTEQYYLEQARKMQEQVAQNHRPVRLPDGAQNGSSQASRPKGNPAPIVVSAPRQIVPSTPSGASREVIFTVPEQMPEPDYDIPEYIAANLRYPPEARRQKVRGKVIVRIVVDKDGRIKDPVVENSVSVACDAEAVRLMLAMPAWKPGRQNGKPVPVYYRIPVVFSPE